MSEVLTEVIKDLEFDNNTRNQCTLSDDTKIRINGLDARAELKPDSNWQYSIDSDIYVVSPEINPTKVKEWTGFEEEVETPTGTSISYRLFDGTDQYYWTGSAWAVSTTNWNTAAEIIANIASFSTTSKKLRIYTNLKTTDKNVTPKLKRIRILIKASCFWEEELFLRSLIPYLKTIGAVGNFRVRLEMNTDTISWGNFQELSDFNVSEIAACFNLTDDPGMDVDILSSYDLVAKTITLTAAQNFDDIILVQFKYGPEVVLMTSPDYAEVPKLPALVIDSISEFETSRSSGKDFIRNKVNYTARIIPDSEVREYDVTLALITKNTTDHLRLSQAYNAHFQNNPLLTIAAIDSKCGVVVLSPFVTGFVASQQYQQTSTMVIRLKNMNFWIRTPYGKYLIKQKGIILKKQKT